MRFECRGHFSVGFFHKAEKWTIAQWLLVWSKHDIARGSPVVIREPLFPATHNDYYSADDIWLCLTRKNSLSMYNKVSLGGVGLIEFHSIALFEV